MKALVLAAGFGTRLSPYTKHTPKPLFTISGRPLLEIIIEQLKNAGCTGLIINTHHLHEQIESFIANRDFGIPVATRFEPAILGTGGAIRNSADFFDTDPFVVMNSDVLTDIDLKKVYEFHLGHDRPATLVLHDLPKLNHVSVNSDHHIAGFHDQVVRQPGDRIHRLAFTGIQVLDSDLLELIRERNDFSSIDTYQHLISIRRNPMACISENHYWTDIGTPEAYWNAAYRSSAPQAFQQAFHGSPTADIDRAKLAGDGSDRQWYRLSAGRKTLILSDHGIREHAGTCEVDSFIRIGNHLAEKNIPVPRIHLHDAFPGLVFLEDLGNTHLQDLVKPIKTREERMAVYQQVIRLLIQMSQNGIIGFTPDMTFQTPSYSGDLIIERECRYFRDAFLHVCTDIEVPDASLEEDFSRLAGLALQDGINGFMHRDFQSRNIMVQENRFFLIDFQGGRIGPLQYDLASLLIDPYVALPFEDQQELIRYCEMILKEEGVTPLENFQKSVIYCSLTRNLQILGAFGFLSHVKKKKWFEQHIPRALQSLSFYLDQTGQDEFPVLKSIVNTLKTERRQI